MSELDPAFASGEKWFLPPEGILDGDQFAIAQRYIDGTRADLTFFAEDPTMDADSRARHASARPLFEALLDSQEARLGAGDAALASRLTRVVEREVDELNRGERSTVTGQAHLMPERLLQVGHPYNVERPAKSPHED